MQAFLTPVPLSRPAQTPNRASLSRRCIPTAKAKKSKRAAKPNPKRTSAQPEASKPKLDAASNSSSQPPQQATAPDLKSAPSQSASPFDGLAAGPATSPRTSAALGKLSRDTETDPKPPTILGDDKRQATRALGRKPKPPPAPITKKTAADFVAEGIVDDVDDDLEDFEKEDIRFGIDNVKDPFKLEEDQRQKVEELRLQEEQTKRAGEQIDVTGDGGVKKLVLHIGDGEVVEKGSRVTVTYVGKFEDGKVFDKSDDGFEFVLGGGKVIKGWEAGVAGMRVGEEAQFTIRADYAYGRRGMPPVIPSGATLVFDIEVIASVGGEEKDIRTVPEFNPDVARTPEQIQREYEGRLETQEERRKGMSLLDRFYIISPFASETGERPPWWINPNITFFLIAVGVSIGTYLLVIAGGVHVGYVDAPVDVNIFK